MATVGRRVSTVVRAETKILSPRTEPIHEPVVMVTAQRQPIIITYQCVFVVDSWSQRTAVLLLPPCGPVLNSSGPAADVMSVSSVSFTVLSIELRRNRLDLILKQNLAKGLSHALQRALNDTAAAVQVSASKRLRSERPTLFRDRKLSCFCPPTPPTGGA